MRFLRYYHNKTIWMAGFLLWGILILLASVMPDSEKIILQSTEHFRWDYPIHFLAYFGFGTLYLLWRGKRDYSLRKAEWLLLPAVTFCFAFLTEYIQLFIPGRTFNLFDLAYNLAGILSSILLVYFYFIRYYLRKKQSTVKVKTKGSRTLKQ